MTTWLKNPEHASKAILRNLKKLKLQDHKKHSFDYPININNIQPDINLPEAKLWFSVKKSADFEYTLDINSQKSTDVKSQHTNDSKDEYIELFGKDGLLCQTFNAYAVDSDWLTGYYFAKTIFPSLCGDSFITKINSFHAGLSYSLMEGINHFIKYSEFSAKRNIQWNWTIATLKTEQQKLSKNVNLKRFIYGAKNDGDINDVANITNFRNTLENKDINLFIGDCSSDSDGLTYLSQVITGIITISKEGIIIIRLPNPKKRKWDSHVLNVIALVYMTFKYCGIDVMDWNDKCYLIASYKNKFTQNNLNKVLINLKHSINNKKKYNLFNREWFIPVAKNLEQLQDLVLVEMEKTKYLDSTDIFNELTKTGVSILPAKQWLLFDLVSAD